MSAVFDVSIVTPGKEHLNYKAVSFKTQTMDGGIQFLANHMPVIMSTIPCVSIINNEDGSELKLFTSTGIIYIKNGKLTFICDAAEFKENIDVKRALDAEERAQQRLNSGEQEVDIERAKRALARSRIRLDFARK